MMELVGLSICGLLLVVTLKGSRPELALLLSIGTGLLILARGIPYIQGVVGEMERMAEKVSFGQGFLSPLFKTVGISFLCQMASELCRDAGERSLGMKVELVGKAMICAITVPMMSSLFDMIVTIVP